MIEIKNLEKSFNKNKVINNLSLTINSGEIVALVGKNGSGKSTLIRLITGLLKADSGNINIGTYDKIGILLGGDVNLYSNLTVYEILNFFGKLNGLNKFQIENKIIEINNALNINSFLNKKAYTLSRGMKQKTALAITLIGDPSIVLLDEPSTGLDIESSNEVINFIKYLKQEKKTILIATHNIFEICDLSDSIAFLANGKIKRHINTKDFLQLCPEKDKNQLLIDYMNEV